MYKVFVVESKYCYHGECVLGAEDEAEALEMVAAYKRHDPENQLDSFGWRDSVSEVKELTSNAKGIIRNCICYRRC